MSASVRPTFHDPNVERSCTRKRRYLSKKAAKDEAKRVSSTRHGHPITVYKCEHCDGWHLSTRQSKQERKDHARFDSVADKQGPATTAT